MKNYLILILMLFVFSTHAQIIPEKSLKDYGYGQKKMAKAPKTVFIKDFFINYQVLSSSSQTAQDMNFNKAVTQMAVGLTGVEIEDFQEITNDAYARATKKLVDAGFKIISSVEAQKSETLAGYTKLSGGKPSRAQLMGYISTAPEGFDFFVKKVTKKGKTKGAFFDVTPKISKEVGNIPVLEFTANLQFVTIEGNSFAGASKLKGKVNYVLPQSAVAQSSEGPFGSKIETSTTRARMVYKGKGAGAAAESVIQYQPKDDIEIPDVVETKKFKEYTATDKNYSTSFSGLVFTSDKKVEVSHQVKADRAAYKEKTQQAVNEYLDVMLDAFIANANK